MVVSNCLSISKESFLLFFDLNDFLLFDGLISGLAATDPLRDFSLWSWSVIFSNIEEPLWGNFNDYPSKFYSLNFFTSLSERELLNRFERLFFFKLSTLSNVIGTSNIGSGCLVLTGTLLGIFMSTAQGVGSFKSILSVSLSLSF